MGFGPLLCLMLRFRVESFGFLVLSGEESGSKIQHASVNSIEALNLNP